MAEGCRMELAAAFWYCDSQDSSRKGTAVGHLRVPSLACGLLVSHQDKPGTVLLPGFLM